MLVRSPLYWFLSAKFVKSVKTQLSATILLPPVFATKFLILHHCCYDPLKRIFLSVKDPPSLISKKSLAAPSAAGVFTITGGLVAL